MNTNEQIKLSGKLIIEHKDEHGNTLETRQVENLVVNVGKTFIVSRMASNTASVMTHMGIGSGTTASDVSQTTLTNQLARVTLTTSGGSPSAPGSVPATITFNAVFAPGVGTGTITEAGMFNAATGGSMLCRTVFAPVSKAANDSISITWTVTIS